MVGLGYYKLHLNGEKVSTHELGAFTTFTSRVYYDAIDCTAAVNAAFVSGGMAEQVVGIVLGNGWYALNRAGSDSNPGSLAVDAGNPKLLFRLSLRFLDGTSQDVRNYYTFTFFDLRILFIPVFFFKYYLMFFFTTYASSLGYLIYPSDLIIQVSV